jgi:hypothetical protein
MANLQSGQAWQHAAGRVICRGCMARGAGWAVVRQKKILYLRGCWETEKSASFLKKRSKKRLIPRGIHHDQRQMLQGIKVFLLLFVHKKKRLLAFAFPNRL